MNEAIDTVQSLVQTEHPTHLSRQLRRGSDPYLQNRRGIVVTSLVAGSAMALISLYQTGLIEGLPEPPLPYIDSDKVDAAPQAYARLHMPDAPIGLNSYATTLALASMGDQDRARSMPWLPLLLLLKTIIDAGQAAKLSVDQWRKHRAFCIWCLLAAIATFISLPLAVPEALAAWRNLSGGE